MGAHYEWVIEELDRPHGSDDCEIIEVDHADTYAEALKRAQGLEFSVIGLVRDENSCQGGRSWAYVTNGQLPEFLTDAYDNETVRVPARFRKQFDGSR